MTSAFSTAKRGRPKKNALDLCLCAGACTPSCRARRARRARAARALAARPSGGAQAEEARRRTAQPIRCGCADPKRHTDACRARRYRAAHPDRAAAQAKKKRADYALGVKSRDELILVHRALATVRTALRRGTIVPPRTCDACFSPASESRPLTPFIADPHDPRAIAWFCAHCRKSVPALGTTVTLGWTWPGAAGEVPRPWWRIEIPPAAIEAANAAVADVARGGRVSDPHAARRWAKALFAAAAIDPERVYAIARRRRSISEDARVNAMLWWWADLERDERVRRAHNEREIDAEKTVTIVPRTRQAPIDVPAIGDVAVPPSPEVAFQRTPSPPRSLEEEDAILERIDSSLADIDQLLKRFERPGRE